MLYTTFRQEFFILYQLDIEHIVHEARVTHNLIEVKNGPFIKDSDYIVWTR